jgi:hypothetical protein
VILLVTRSDTIELLGVENVQFPKGIDQYEKGWQTL